MSSETTTTTTNQYGDLCFIFNPYAEVPYQLKEKFDELYNALAKIYDAKKLASIISTLRYTWACSELLYWARRDNPRQLKYTAMQLLIDAFDDGVKVVKQVLKDSVDKNFEELTKLANEFLLYITHYLASIVDRIKDTKRVKLQKLLEDGKYTGVYYNPASNTI